MARLPPLGQCSYNGFVFNEKTRTTQYDITSDYGQDGRTVVTRTTSITLTTHIDALSTTDPAVAFAVSKLTVPGGVLIYRGRGLGNPDINTGRVRDVAYGPKPGKLSLDPMGAGKGVKLTWSVTAVLPPCADASSQFDLLDFAFTVSHQMDDAGFITRTIAGSLTIPNGRVAGELFAPDSPDRYRNRIAPRRLRGFFRTYGPWLISEDRTRLDFAFIDTEVPGEPLPPKVISLEGSETLRSSAVGLQSWEGTINATYRLVRGAWGMEAAPHFLALAAKRCGDLQDKLRLLPNTAEVIPTSLEFNNPALNGRPVASFSLGFTFTVPLKNLIESSGIWRSLRLGTDWDVWQASIADATSPYGTLRLTFEPADDVQVSLCRPTTGELIGSRGTFWSELVRGAESRGRNPAEERAAGAYVQGVLAKAFKPPTPAGSWLAYENEVFAEFDSGIVPLTRLPAQRLDGSDDLFSRNNDFTGRPYPANNLPVLPPWVPQPAGRLLNIPINYMRRTEPTCYLYMRGYAIRAGYLCDPPRLLDVNGVPPIPMCRLDRGEGFGRSVKANAGVPIHMTRWNVRYFMPTLPVDPMPAPSNPLAESR